MSMPNRIVLDAETTGLKPARYRGDEILSLSIIDYEGNTLFDRLFKPRWKRRWDAASRVNDIWPEDVADAPTIEASVREIESLLSSAETIVAYNASFDLSFVHCLGIELSGGTAIIDTMTVFSEFRSVPDYRHGGLKRFKLAEAAAYIGYVWEGRPHRSLADARACLAVQRWLDDRCTREPSLHVAGF